MSDLAAFQGTFFKVTPLQGGKASVFHIEVPQERTDAALKALGGWPDAANPKWVAVALLDKKIAQHKDDGVQAPKNLRRKFSEISLAEQSALKCTDQVFRRFLWEKHMIRDEEFEASGQIAIDAAATAVRVACGVNTRADILPGTNAADKWAGVLSDFEGWKNL